MKFAIRILGSKMMALYPTDVEPKAGENGGER
jgi:hypothetical protein